MAKIIEDAALQYDEGNDVPGLLPNGELHFAYYLNEAVQKDISMHIKTYPMGQEDIYLDCGTLKGYEEALIYTLLKESIYSKDHLTFIKRVIDI